MSTTPSVTAPSAVTATPPAPAEQAHRHFAGRLAVETDPADVAADLAASGPEGLPFVLVDARAPEAFAAGHLPGAMSLPWQAVDADTVAGLPADTLVVTYCWSIHCNAATKAATRLAALGVPVKEMIGGITAWRAEGHPVTEADGSL